MQIAELKRIPTATASEPARRTTAGQDAPILNGRSHWQQRRGDYIVGGIALLVLVVIAWFLNQWSDMKNTVSAERMREALAGDADTLFTMQHAGEAEVYHLSQRRFLLNAQNHRLVLLKQLTRELAAQELAVWKKVIRVIAHELNNSLAPISSLAHSGMMLAQEPDTLRLERVFTTIAERSAHLATFIDGYARFAKLPKPRVAPVDWQQFLPCSMRASSSRC